MRALLIVDVQVDFLPGGALGGADRDQIIPLINELMKLPFDYIVATKDWHPVGHISFASTHGKEVGERISLEGVDQVLWPDHCIQGSPGSEFSPLLNTHKIMDIVYKGTEVDIDSYSAFFDNLFLRKTHLDDLLKRHKVEDLTIAGLVTDYCVKYSTLDALELGYRVHVIPEACRAINLSPDDEEKAIEEMKRAGAKILTLSEVSTNLL